MAAIGPWCGDGWGILWRSCSLTGDACPRGVTAQPIHRRQRARDPIMKFVH